MPDITMCSGNYCPLAKTCYRYKATPSEYRQSYFTKPPIKDGKCDYYWELKTEEDEQ
jgi:alpha-galactosidase/6-phospho-beta-glucosidase family protein